MSSIDLMRLVREKIKTLNAYHVENLNSEIKLHANESPYPPSPEILKRVFIRLNELELNRYPDPECRCLKQAIANKTGALPEQINSSFPPSALFHFEKTNNLAILS